MRWLCASIPFYISECFHSHDGYRVKYSIGISITSGSWYCYCYCNFFWTIPSPGCISQVEVRRRPAALNKISLPSGPSLAESPVGNWVRPCCYLLSDFVICHWLSSWMTEVLIRWFYCEPVSLCVRLYSAGCSGEVEGHALVSPCPERPERHQPELPAHAHRSWWS